MRRSLFLVSFVIAGAAVAQAPEEEIPSGGTDYEDAQDIVITGQKPPGSVLGDIAPEVTLSPADIRSFGVSSLAELLAELAPQTGSGQGRGGEQPIVLLNGKRVSGFAEVRDIPTEAIQRTEILPEEVALKYGYRPNQKVVNVVLRSRFNAITAEVEAGAPTEGGRFSPELEVAHLRIINGTRINLAGNYQRSSALFESERDIIQAASAFPYDVTGNLADAGRYRTLLPATDQVRVNGVIARTIFNDVSASLNASLSYDDSDAALGLPTTRIALPAANPFSPFAEDSQINRTLGEFGALAQRSRNVQAHLGTTLTGALDKWNWTLLGNYDRNTSRTITGRGFDLSAYQARIVALDPTLNPYAQIDESQLTGTLVDRARSRSSVGNVEAVLTGPLLELPSGALTSTLKLGGVTSDFRSRSLRSGIPAEAELGRDIGSGQISLDLPIASRRRATLTALGDLSANFNIGFERLSDFGTLRTIGGGLTWSPVKQLNLIASINQEEGAPTTTQLGNPLVTTTGIRVFDYIQGETVEITRLSGGNAALAADDRRVIKLGATLRPLAGSDLSLVANYTDSRIDNPIASFPTATVAIEAAFPDRFQRDASGRLIRIDSRPINFERQERRDLRWGLNFSKQISTPPPQDRRAAPDGQQRSMRELMQGEGGEQRPGQQPGQQPGDRAAGGPDGGAGRAGAGQGRGPGRGFGGGGFGGGGGGGRGTRLQLALYHTVHIKEEIQVYANGPTLDLLNGDAVGSEGGQPRHEIQAQAGLTRNGFGARLFANWQSATTVNGLAAGDQLRFDDLATVNLRLFANLGQQRKLVESVPFLRGSRVSIGVNNLFNDRQRVRDVAGGTPIGFQPDYLNPLGRSVQISFRKLFFGGRPGGPPPAH